MELRKRLSFSDARIESITLVPTEKEPKCVLLMAASLLPDAAELLGCDWAYKEGIPREGLQDLALNGILRDVELHLPTGSDMAQYESYFPELIHKFKLKRVQDAKLEVTFRVHETRRFADLLELLAAVNKESFEAAIRPRQGELFEGGTRVDLSGGEDQAGQARDRQPKASVYACELCAKDVPLNEDGTQHIDDDGVVTECRHPSALATAAMHASRGAIASRAHMKHV